MGKCGNCDKDKSKGKDETTMKSQTSSFELILKSGNSVTFKNMSALEAKAMLARMGGGSLKKKAM